ncbi:MAG: AAA family ATPase [Oscillospiraceae bacterium]|nr:AAA family ATPase [Oscillospiraceae bacterium]
MMIRKCTASFGKLENESLRFHDGLNVIYAPNESGKSTWCAFIMAMLYGVDSAERAKAGHLPDKLRYAPWSGMPMEGTMELTADRCDITITRRSRSKSAPMQEFSAVYTGTATPVRGLSADNAGEQLTGVSKDVFRRSAFIAQGAVGVTGSRELEQRIASIVTTGEEACSWTEADERLRAWQRRRRWNRRGLLPELEGKMDETERRLEEMSGSIQTAEELERRLEQARTDCAALEQQVTDARRRERREALETLSKSREGLRESSDKHDEALDTLSNAREQLRLSRFGLRDPDSLEQDLNPEIEELRTLQQLGDRPRSPLLALLCILLALGLAALYTQYRYWFVIAAAALACLAALVLLMRWGTLKRAHDASLQRLKELQEKYHVLSDRDLLAALDEHKLLWEAMEQAEKAERRQRGVFETARATLGSVEEAALRRLDFADGSTEAARLSRELAAKRAEVEDLSRHSAALNGRLAAMGDPLVLASSLSCMKEEYGVICDELDAIVLAADTLREANDEIQRRFSPELGRVASGYMSAVTGGRYAEVLLDRDFSAMTRAEDESVTHEAEYLSAGTLDMLYLAVRLAVCELALPEGETCPLILDDALANLDDERLKQAMKLLAEIARERQVILFTCRK